MKPVLLIARTAVYNNADGGYYFEKRFNIHQRINHKASDQRHYHISNMDLRGRPIDHESRQNRYEVKCLEKGIRPFNYPDNLWNEYLRDIANEEHFNKCEAKNAWRYEY